jgi:hypothetical protein
MALSINVDGTLLGGDPITVTRSRWPLALTWSTPKPLSSLKKWRAKSGRLGFRWM